VSAHVRCTAGMRRVYGMTPVGWVGWSYLFNAALGPSDRNVRPCQVFNVNWGEELVDLKEDKFENSVLNFK
jgi:hypothetical protein